MVTRREQLGTDDHQLQAKGKKPSSRGRGKTRDDDDDAHDPENHDGNQSEGDAKPEDGEVGPKTNNAKPKPKPKRKPRTPKTDAKSPKTPPKRMRRPAAAPSKSKKPAGKKSQETEEGKGDHDKKGKGGKRPVAKDVEAEGEKKEARTWGGRWIPEEEGPAKRKMIAIKGVWELFLQSKFHSQSSLQPAFFKLCNQAFRTQDIDKAETTVEQYTAAAEIQVEPFLKIPAASISFELLSIILPEPPKNHGG